MPLQIVILDDILSFLFSISPFTCFFLLFAPLRDLPDTKKPWKSWYCHQKSWFPNSKKIVFRARFWHPSGQLWIPFWPPLRSLGLLLALPGCPKRSKSRKKSERLRSRIALGAPRDQKSAKGAPGPPKWTPMVWKIDLKWRKNRTSKSSLYRKI